MTPAPAPERVTRLAAGCACTWTSPSGAPGWPLKDRHPACTSPVHPPAGEGSR